VGIKEVGEVEIILSHLEEVEIEIFSMGRITETKETGMDPDMSLETRGILLIINLKEIIIKKKSFIHKSCKIQMIPIILKKILQIKIVFMIKKKSKRTDHITENNKKIIIRTQRNLEHIEEEEGLEEGLEEEEAVGSRIMMVNKKMKKLLAHFHRTIFNLIIRRRGEEEGMQIITRIMTINKLKNSHRKIAIKLLTKDKIVKVKIIDAESIYYPFSRLLFT
jgi:hypothetical protein